MMGYNESITDPSYKGQILIQTYPLIGNYGVNKRDFESDSPKIEGYIIHELCRSPSHWSSEWSLDETLEKYGVPGIEGVDTRALTKKLRYRGTMLGILHVFYNDDPPSNNDILDEVKRVEDPNDRDLVAEVCTKEVIEHSSRKSRQIVLIDCGVKKSIINSLIDRGVGVIQVPSTYSADDVLSRKPAGVVISNGPGDPKRISYLTKTIKKIFENGIPIFGICLGAQILALAFKGDTYKLKFGHRGQNHPCIETTSDRCFITSQNHGYAIEPESLRNTELEVTFKNANDGTVEGVKHSSSEASAVQWHPEASPGPVDTAFLFDEFVRVIKNTKK